MTFKRFSVSIIFHEDDVGELTLSSRTGKGLYGGETLREDDVRVLTLSSRAGGDSKQQAPADLQVLVR